MARQYNYNVTKDRKHIYITFNKSDKVYFTDYNKGLYKLFTSDVFISAHTNLKDKYLKFFQGDIRPYFHHIVYCYYYRGLNANNANKILKQFKEERTRDNTVIDHLNNNLYDNRKCNLSLIDSMLNLKKPNTDKYFKTLFKLDKAYDGKYYRVQFTYIGGFLRPQIKVIRYICDNIQEYIHLIKWLKSNKWQIRRCHEGQPLTNGVYYIFNKYPFVPCLKTKYKTSDIQRKLLNIPLKKFRKGGEAYISRL